jgi:flagella basal body P-ring formation protein FlgA
MSQGRRPPQQPRRTGPAPARRWAAALLLAALAPAAHATTAEALRSTAERALRNQYQQPGSRLVATAAPLDSRLRLRPCERPLAAQLPPRAVTARVAVQVSCPDPGGWSIRVPVNVQLFRSVLVTSRPLARGDSVTAADVHSEERDVARLGYGYVDDLSQIAGRSLARPLAPGSVLTPGALGARRMVRAGEPVLLISRLGGIEVRTRAQALDGGDSGMRLRVRNDSSGRVVDAVVLAAGQVEALP